MHRAARAWSARPWSARPSPARAGSAVRGLSVRGLPVPGTRALLTVLAHTALLASCGRQKVITPVMVDGGDDAAATAGDAQGDAQLGEDGGVGPGCPTPPAARPAGTPSWDSVIGFKNPQSWYATDVAAYVAENVLYYQNPSGGWPKNIDMSYRYGVDAMGAARVTKSMFDNNATTTQLRFLAYIIGSWPDCARLHTAFDGGLGFVFAAQYATNGGWPQTFPLESGYSRHITYNDDAMIHVMSLLRDIAYGATLYGFLPAETVEKATTAMNKGLDCILKTQIVADGKKTGWCAQHDEVTLAPAPARAYELESESGREGPNILSFLLTLDLARPELPKADIVAAVEAAVTFYDSIKLTGIKYVQGTNDMGVADSWIEEDPAAPPLWARFYDYASPFQAFFCDRDGVKKSSLAEIGVERRGGYSWYSTGPGNILGTSYPNWVAKWSSVATC